MKTVRWVSAILALLAATGCGSPVESAGNGKPGGLQTSVSLPDLPDNYFEYTRALAAEKASLQLLDLEEEQIMRQYGHNAELRATVIEANTPIRAAAKRRIEFLQTHLLTVRPE